MREIWRWFPVKRRLKRGNVSGTGIVYIDSPFTFIFHIWIAKTWNKYIMADSISFGIQKDVAEVSAYLILGPVGGLRFISILYFRNPFCRFFLVICKYWFCFIPAFRCIISMRHCGRFLALRNCCSLSVGTTACLRGIFRCNENFNALSKKIPWYNEYNESFRSAASFPK